MIYVRWPESEDATDEQFPYGDSPAGYHWEWQPEERGRWQVLPGDEKPKPCRFLVTGRTACGEPSVARVDRSSTSSKRRPNWWHYCGEHLYGRRIHDGRIEHCVAVHDQPPTMIDTTNPTEQAAEPTLADLTDDEQILAKADEVARDVTVHWTVRANRDAYVGEAIRTAARNAAAAVAGMLRTAAKPTPRGDLIERMARAIADADGVGIEPFTWDNAANYSQREHYLRMARAALRQAGGQA